MPLDRAVSSLGDGHMPEARAPMAVPIFFVELLVLFSISKLGDVSSLTLYSMCFAKRSGGKESPCEIALRRSLVCLSTATISCSYWSKSSEAESNRVQYYSSNSPSSLTSPSSAADLRSVVDFGAVTFDGWTSWLLCSWEGC